MNHGIVAAESLAENIDGFAVWDLAIASGGPPAVFGTVGLNSGYWSEHLVRSIGIVRLNKKGLDLEHLRFRPSSKEVLCRMCSECVVHHSTSNALVVPDAVTDAQAVELLERVWEIATELDMEASEGHPIRPVLDKFHFTVDWIYLLGFFPHDPVSIFLSNNHEVVAKVDQANTQAKDYYRLEKW